MKNVVVTGVGIKSCIGNTYDEVLHSLQNGKSGISANKSYTDMGFRSQVSGSINLDYSCLLYTSPSPRDVEEPRMPSAA